MTPLVGDIGFCKKSTTATLLVCLDRPNCWIELVCVTMEICDPQPINALMATHCPYWSRIWMTAVPIILEVMSLVVPMNAGVLSEDEVEVLVSVVCGEGWIVMFEDKDLCLFVSKCSNEW